MSKKQQNSKSENKTELASAISMPDVNIGIKNSDRKSIAEEAVPLYGGRFHTVLEDPHLPLERHRTYVQLAT